MTIQTHSQTGIPSLDLDPFSDEFIADPYPGHEAMREAGPVVYLPRYNVYALARYEEVHTALTNWQALHSSSGVGLSNFRTEKPWRPPSLLLETDPPRQDAPRSVLAKVLGPRALRNLREEWQQKADELVDEVLQASEFDGVTQIAQRYPLRVFPDALGVSEEGREHLLPYGDFTFNAFGPHNHLVEKGKADIAEHMAWVAQQCQRDALSAPSFGDDIHCAADRGEITHEQAPLIVRSLLTAGVDTTVHGIGAVLYCFASHPTMWQQLRAEPRLMRSAFDEAVRLISPVQTFFRTTTSDVEIGGVVVPDGEKVLMFLSSANRDPRRWENPDDFDLHRDPSGHVGFGMGIHQCVGQHVARLEAESVLTALLARVKTLELAGEPVIHLNNTLRGFESVPLRVTTV